MPKAQSNRALIAILFIALVFLGLALTGRAMAQDLQGLPPLSAHVMDLTGTLDAGQRQSLEAKLTSFEQSRGTQLVILMVPSTQPEDISDYTQRAGDAWKIGRKDIGDGLLLVVAKNDRKVRIATTKTLEGAVPDLVARQIIDNALAPRFKQGDYAGGLNLAADQLMARISGENLALPSAKTGTGSGRGLGGFDWTSIAVFLFLIVPVGVRLLSGILGRKLGSVATGGAVGLLAWVLTSSLVLAGVAGVIAILFALFASVGALGGLGRNSGNAGWGSAAGGFGGGWGGGSGGGGGGFSSGGGGDFGGGGASGDW